MKKPVEIAHKERFVEDALVVGLHDERHPYPYIVPLIRTLHRWHMPPYPDNIEETITLGQAVYIEELPVHIRLAYRVLATVWKTLYDAAIPPQPPLENWEDLDKKE